MSRKQILVNLCDYFGDEVVVLSVEGCDTIVGFRTFVTKSLKMVKVSGSDENDDVAKVVRRVKAEVREIHQPREYDLSDFTFSNTVADTSETLLRLVSALVSDGNVTKPSLTISQTMQPHISGARNQATIGFDIKLHHKLGSSDVIKLRNSHGLVSSYYEVLRFCKSAASYVSKNTGITIS